MRILAALALIILITLVPSKVYAFDEQIGDVAVPYEVSMNIQSVYQAYIIYSVRIVDGNYVCLLARDTEPHQYPTRTITFSPEWVMIADTGYQEIPKKIEPKIEPKREEPKKPGTPGPVETPKPIEKPVETPKPIEKPIKPVEEPIEEPEPVEPPVEEPPEQPPIVPKPEEPEEEPEDPEPEDEPDPTE